MAQAEARASRAVIAGTREAEADTGTDDRTVYAPSPEIKVARVTTLHIIPGMDMEVMRLMRGDVPVSVCTVRARGRHLDWADGMLERMVAVNKNARAVLESVNALPNVRATIRIDEKTGETAASIVGSRDEFACEATVSGIEEVGWSSVTVPQALHWWPNGFDA
jgi:hypothetical protein